MRQQTAVLRQGVAAYRQVLPGGHLPLRFQRIVSIYRNITGSVNLAGGILADVFRRQRRSPSDGQLFVHMRNRAAGIQYQLAIAGQGAVAQGNVALAAQ